MNTPSGSPQDQRTYVFDAESPTEMARLLEHEALITEKMGGLFPEGTDLSQVHEVLDIACGPGGWALEVARQYPHLHVTGFDISKRMIEYARAHARARGLANTTFTVMDAMKPLQFPDQSFDLVNARTIVAFMTPQTWPQLLQEMYRICRPGGIVRLTEGEMPITNGQAFEKITSLMLQTMKKYGRIFSPDGRNFGITPMMSRLLRDAGFQDIHQWAHGGDFSAGEENESVHQDFMIMYQTLRPFLVQAGMITDEEYEVLYQQAMAEMLSDDFCGIGYVLTVWGKRPLG